jgi:hypothetical protein
MLNDIFLLVWARHVAREADRLGYIYFDVYRLGELLPSAAISQDNDKDGRDAAELDRALNFRLLLRRPGLSQLFLHRTLRKWSILREAFDSNYEVRTRILRTPATAPVSREGRKSAWNDFEAVRNRESFSFLLSTIWSVRHAVHKWNGMGFG